MLGCNGSTGVEKFCWRWINGNFVTIVHSLLFVTKHFASFLRTGRYYIAFIYFNFKKMKWKWEDHSIPPWYHSKLRTRQKVQNFRPLSTISTPHAEIGEPRSWLARSFYPESSPFIPLLLSRMVVGGWGSSWEARVLSALLEREEVRGASRKWDCAIYECGGSSGWLLADVGGEFLRWEEEIGSGERTLTWFSSFEEEGAPDTSFGKAWWLRREVGCLK
jgi:hypothetical protein